MLHISNNNGINSESVLISETKSVIDDQGKESSFFPYNPKLKDGKVLYGTAKDDTTQYQTVTIAHVDGTEEATTGKLEIRSDYLDIMWLKDGFLTLESTDSLDEALNGEATIFTTFNSSAIATSEIIIEGMALDCQRKTYDLSRYYAFGYQNSDTKGVALYDYEAGEVYFINDIEGHVASPTVTPESSRIIWANDGALCYVDITPNILDRTIPQISTK